MKLEAIAQIMDNLRQSMQLADRAQLKFIRHLLELALAEVTEEMDRQLEAPRRGTKTKQ